MPAFPICGYAALGVAPITMDRYTFQAVHAVAPEETVLRDFIGSLPWPVIAMNHAGHVTHVSGDIYGCKQGPVGGEHTLATLFPAFHAALRGSHHLSPADEADVTRQIGEHTVHEHLILRTVSGCAYLIVVDQTALRALEVTSAQTSRLAALGFMVAGVCHEISNPITAVQSMLQLLQSEKQLSPPLLAKGLANIGSNIKRLLEISSRLMNFSRVAEETGVAFRLDTLIDESVAIIRQDPRAARLDILFEPGDDAMIFGSMSCMQEVFVNIIENALQAMEGVGTIRIGVTHHAPDRVAVEIRDTGPGISHQAMHRIFEPFFTTKAVGLGTGLGLSICNEILHEHRGTICAENNLDGGACFRVELPHWTKPQ